ncbi:ferredoxin reductase family protein [Homoserinimonas sp. OAct 916]|uniref:ferredoxin reductase family protein n=1 Tax=Homoserinimonas sp. OAct 916 TaxID=2211450 RepID=UPI000DBE16FA|nr:ferredoxin reductase family protein [Homoserinimonas sp. OAct 916]
MTAGTASAPTLHLGTNADPHPRRSQPGRTARLRSRLVRAVLAIGFTGVLLMWWMDTPAGPAATPGQLANTIGELAGMLGGYLVCAQVLLIARIPWFESAVGLDKLVRWHRNLGTTVIFLILTHVGLMIVGGMLLDHSTPWNEVFILLGSYPDILTALIGTALFLAVGLSSARLVRMRLSYETWYWLHVTTYAAIFLTFLHQLSAGVNFVSNPVNRLLWLLLYLGTASAVLTWRFVVPAATAWRNRLSVDRVVMESSFAASVWLRGRNLEELGVRAGNFMLFRFIGWGHLLTAHPYSISRVPQADMLRITVGALGDHSSLIRWLRPGTFVFAEGPFGHFTADRASRRRILLIAGGAGIGPICALAEEMTAAGRDVVLLYRARSQSHLALLAELQSMPGLTVIALPGRRWDLGYDPLSEDALAYYVPDVGRREVFICGPEAMALQAESSLRSLHVPGEFIHREELSMS